MNRYSSRRSRVSVGDPGRSRGRWQGAVALLLLIVLIVTVVMALPAMRYQREAHAFFAERMLNECNDAKTRTSSLSRTGGTSQASLALIRSKVYAMQLLNQADASLAGTSPMIPESTFTGLMTTVENYISRTTLGAADTGDLQTELSTELDALEAQLSALQ